MKITDIENELGVSKGTLYQYLKSKKDLFPAVIQMLLKKLAVILWYTLLFKRPNSQDPTMQTTTRSKYKSIKLKSNRELFDEFLAEKKV